MGKRVAVVGFGQTVQRSSRKDVNGVELIGEAVRAALASAERYLMEGAPQFALPNAQTAMAGLPEYSTDWIRAQDINLVAEAQLSKLKKKR